jgi:predicted NBD/HSP70 family sugar kinase
VPYATDRPDGWHSEPMTAAGTDSVPGRGEASQRRATPATAREINDRLAVEQLLVRGPLTAAELKSLTGLSRPTVSELLTRLQAGGVVVVDGETDVVRRGPNARLYRLVAAGTLVAGLDIRADSIQLELADLTGTVVGGRSISLDGSGADIDALADTLAAEMTRAGQPPHAIAVGAPGLIDPATGRLRESPCVPLWPADLVDVLHQRLGVPVLLENEVNLAAIAELRDGAGRDRDTFVLIWLGHGIGAGVVLDGRLRRGASGGTGEIGFLAVPGTGGVPSAKGCDFGYHDLAGAAAVCALARKHRIPAPAGDDAAAAEAAVAAAFAAGPRGERFLDALAANIALGAQAITLVLDPGRIILGGEVGRAGGPALASRVERALTTLTPLPTEVRPTQLSGSAVLAGAVRTALDSARATLLARPNASG